jgi:class 3 adenylate cyclase/tetratricopeptide (TPR) repeat protein
MRCSKCGSDNPAGKKFCGDCGAPFANRCPNCGAENAPTKGFCGDCGTALPSRNATQPATPSVNTPNVVITAEQASAANDGERKTVTALFADIKGSTELMAELDPEEASSMVDPALTLMIDAVRRYDGYVVQSTGDGIFALFGAPLAHEDHPQRALLAAIRMQEELRRYSARLVAKGNGPIQCRVGVNTGEVVVRSIPTGESHSEYAPIGHTTNLAARMQAVAPVGSIAATETTRKLCEGYFIFKLLGPALLKGVGEPVNVWEVTGVGLLRNRLQRAARRGLTRFVGREREIEALRHAAGVARAGHGQVVAAMAEPGVGKSRLFHEFKLISQSDWLIVEAFSVSHGKASSYLPVIELLKDYFGIGVGDDERKRREKVNGKIVTLDRSLEDTLPYLFSLLSLNSGDDPLAQMDPQIKRQRTHEVVKRIVQRESVDRPLMLIFEDLHWIDSETQGLLNVLVDNIANARILLLVNYRPEYRHEWGNRAYYSQLRLDPLGQESADEMVSSLLGNEVELGPLRRLISEKTEGNPFFIEEIVQSLFEDGSLVRNGRLALARPLTQIKVPTTVQAVLASRIDRLTAEEKELLQALAVLGREFPLRLVQQVWQSPHPRVTALAEHASTALRALSRDEAGEGQPELEQLLLRLQLGEFINEQPSFPDVEYVFKHALTQEVAYNSLLSERRRSLHERAGVAIEALYASRLDDHLRELARHYERSGDTVKGIEYLERAGHQAISRGSHAEAITLFTSALELLKTLPETTEHLKKALRLQLGLGSALQAIKGHADAEAGQALTRAQELCQQIGATPEMFEALLGLAGFYYVGAEVLRAYELTQQLVAIAEANQDTQSLLKAHMMSGMVLGTMGDVARARRHLELATSFGSPAQRSFYGPAALCWHASVLLGLGYPDQALDKSKRALELARELSDPFTYANALANTAVFHELRREGEATLHLADENLRLSIEHGFQQYSAFAMATRGAALIQLDRAEEGLPQLQQAVQAAASGGRKTLVSALDYAALAEGYGKVGCAAEGLRVVAEGLEASEKPGDGLKAELWRIRGDLLLLESKPLSQDEAEASFREAIEIARHQQVKWWELRATVSLAVLLKNQNRGAEARSILAEIYGWFTEGFDTADLKDAKRLLDELACN